MSPELLLQDESGERDEAESFKAKKETKECDVYAFSMVGVEVRLFQMVHILVFKVIAIDFIWTTTLPQDKKLS